MNPPAVSSWANKKQRPNQGLMEDKMWWLPSSLTALGEWYRCCFHLYFGYWLDDFMMITWSTHMVTWLTHGHMIHTHGHMTHTHGHMTHQVVWWDLTSDRSLTRIQKSLDCLMKHCVVSWCKCTGGGREGERDITMEQHRRHTTTTYKCRVPPQLASLCVVPKERDVQ